MHVQQTNEAVQVQGGFSELMITMPQPTQMPPFLPLIEVQKNNGDRVLLYQMVSSDYIRSLVG